MTDCAECAKKQKEIEKQGRKIKRLEKRLLTKQKYEEGLLLNTGATPRFIHEVQQKDLEAMKEE